MKKSEFRAFIKEMFIDLIYRDDEVKDIMLEFLKENSNLLIEGSAPQMAEKKEPADPELYDKLTLIASGQQSKMSYNGKTVRTPNYGAGFKSGKMIQEWANKAYSKIGGNWESVRTGESNPENIAALQSMFGGGDTHQGARIAGVAKSNDDHALRNTIKQNISTQLLDENFQPAGDMTDILMDTARTTLQDFPSTHEGSGLRAGASRESFQGTPEQAFGAKAANNWATLAFEGMSPGE